ncbi:MAG: ABC transporter ATP-binding protein [Patescibacteria group bacterium]
MSNSIILNDISKKYTLVKERPVLLKNLFLPPKKEEVWALKNVSLTIKKGETIGIVGDNGSGKSTLLKIIAGITTPTQGNVKVNGRVSSLIELGAGFHPDLTGKENVYLNGQLLGFTKKELDKKYNEIVEFTDIGEYINQPIRTYSSGMVVRLGFSVAVHLDPEILLIDEVLTVGDEEFQRKCIRKINILRKNGKTIIMVSHDLSLIKILCSKIVWLEHGKFLLVGNSEKVIHSYLDRLTEKEEIIFLDESAKKNLYRGQNDIVSGKIKFEKVVLLNQKGLETNSFESNEKIVIRAALKTNMPINNPIFGLIVYSESGDYLGGTNSIADKILERINGIREVDYIIERISLLPGKYFLDLVINDKTGKKIYNRYGKILPLFVKGLKNKDGYPVYSGHIQIPCKWKYYES